MNRELLQNFVSKPVCLSAIETVVLVHKACVNEAMNRSNGFRWYSPFRDGRELVEDSN
jgi:hypothetical protein